MKPIFFTTVAELRKWFAKNHAKETELIVGYYKVNSGKKGISWSESVDQALCFGWIDSVRRSVDAISYCNRFTPRKPGSNWSAINIAKIEELTKLGLMQPAGIAAFEKRLESKSKVYSYENEPGKLSTAHEKKFKANKKAWAWFTTQAPSYQKIAIHWVVGAKLEATREKRLAELISESATGMRLKQYRPVKK